MTFAQGHALLIGVGAYANAPRLNVPATVHDAQALAAVLRDPGFCGYPHEQVELITNAKATREGIRAALDRLAERAGADDTAVVFYAGHGMYGDDGYALLANDTRLPGGKVAGGTGVAVAELIVQLRAIKTRRLLLIVNACHSGELSPVLGDGDEPDRGETLPANAAAALLATGEGRVIITACRNGQVSFVGPGPLTLFTRALVAGLQGGVASNYGFISALDLYTHVYFTLDEAVPRLPAELRGRYGEQQEPELTVLKGVGPFPIALYRGTAARGEFDSAWAPPEGAAVREVSPAHSKAMLQQFAPRRIQQTISGNAQVGAAIAGDVHGDVNVTQTRGSGQSSGISFGGSGSGGGSFGDITIGDVAGRDIIKGRPKDDAE